MGRFCAKPRSCPPGRLVALACLAAGVGWCQKDLADASLEQLLDTKVTTVSKKEKKLARTAAAVFVITQEDIQRSGAANIPDLLRMVPGVNVAQIDGSSWAISVRGFNSRYSNKVLVMVDGRSVYSSDFSGVFWDQIDLPLDEIERIEVVRGPGGSVWGANAVNGVISIMTKSSKAAHGGSASLSAGSYVDTDDHISYSGSAGSAGSYRIWGAYNNVADSVEPSGVSGGDGWEREHAGMRSDWSIGRNDSLTVEGDLFANEAGHTIGSLFDLPGSGTYWQSQEAGGGSILGRWTHAAGDDADQSLQVYYSTYHRTELSIPISENSLDFDYRNRHRVGSRHEIVWGAGYRRTDSDLSSASWISFSPAARVDALYSAYGEDEIRIADDLWLTLGGRIEHNSYTGFDFEPSARLAWTVTPSSTLWLSASSAVRQPGQDEQGVNVALGTVLVAPNTPALLVMHGNLYQNTEKVTDYEAGYRAQLNAKLSLDLAVFGSLYRDLATIEPLPPTMTQIDGAFELELPYIYANGGRAVNYGGELVANWNVTRRWRISPAFSMLHVNFGVNAQSESAFSQAFALCSPAYTWQARSWVNLPARLTFDQTVSWTSQLAGPGVPSHWRLDARVARALGESAEVSLVGQSLLRPGVLEFGSQYGIVGTEFPRSVFGRVAFRF